jgi:NAD(P)-dependent dehydrogenase (short-subunit alcohol dehydrogenase family)
MDLDGKVCVVTGAASGIGEEIARQFGARGATVAIVDVRAEAAGQVAGQITGKGPGSAAEFSCDLRSVGEIEATVAAVTARFGRLDVLVNVAGLANRTPVEDITEAEWDLLNDVNLKAPFLVAQRSGKIINIASHRAHTTDGNHLIYAATKAGLQAVTRDLAVAGGRHGIEVNTVSPGYVLTPMTEHNLRNEEWLSHMTSRIPLGRLLEMREVANAVLFLASPSTSGITGQNLLVDGGWTVHE